MRWLTWKAWFSPGQINIRRWYSPQSSKIRFCLLTTFSLIHQPGISEQVFQWITKFYSSVSLRKCSTAWMSIWDFRCYQSQWNCGTDLIYLWMKMFNSTEWNDLHILHEHRTCLTGSVANMQKIWKCVMTNHLKLAISSSSIVYGIGCAVVSSGLPKIHYCCINGISNYYFSMNFTHNKNERCFWERISANQWLKQMWKQHTMGRANSKSLSLSITPK